MRARGRDARRPARTLGYSAAEVDTAILSHLHQDHIGGIPELSQASPDFRSWRPEPAIRGSFGPFPAEITYTIHPEGNATTLTNTFDLQPPGPLSLVALMVTRRIKSEVAVNLDVLKQTLEGA